MDVNQESIVEVVCHWWGRNRCLWRFSTRFTMNRRDCV